jgi:nicotinamidase/pyrazinamidase
MKRLHVDGARDALLIVDVQNDFCSGGALGVKGGEEVVPVVNSLTPLFRHVVLTQDWHPPGHSSFASAHPGARPFQRIEAAHGSQTLWPDHCVQGTRGAENHPLLVTQAARLVVRKGTNPELDSYSTFYENDRRTPTGLGSALKELGISGLYLVGLATDFCVYFSALDARRLGFAVTVVEDGCRAIDLEGSLDEARSQMGQAGAAFAFSHHLL